MRELRKWCSMDPGRSRLLEEALPELSAKSVFSPCYLPFRRGGVQQCIITFSFLYSKIFLELIIAQFFTCLISSGVLLFQPIFLSRNLSLCGKLKHGNTCVSFILLPLGSTLHRDYILLADFRQGLDVPWEFLISWIFDSFLFPSLLCGSEPGAGCMALKWTSGLRLLALGLINFS